MEFNDDLKKENEYIEDASPIFFGDDEPEVKKDSEPPARKRPTVDEVMAMQEEEAREKKSKKEKKKRPGRTAYLVFVLVLVLAIIGGLIWVWIKCVEYQASSAATLVAQAAKELSDRTGLSLESSLIPKINDDGDYEYVLKSGKKPVAKVTLTKKGAGLLGLALFEKKDVSSLVKLKVIMTEDCSVDGSQDREFKLEEYVLPETRNLKNYGFGVQSYVTGEVEWLYDEAQLIVRKDGNFMPLVDLGGDTYLAADYYSGNEKDTIRAKAAELSARYALFMSNDLSYWDLDPYIIGGTPLRTLLAGMDMTWFGYHYYTEVNDLMMSDPMRVGNRFALVNASFNYDVIRWDGTDRSPIELCLIMYLCDDGEWRLADLENNIQLELDMTPQTPWEY